MDTIQKMVKAHRTEAALWSYRDYRSGDFEVLRGDEVKAKGNWRVTPGGVGQREFERLRDDAAMRAAVRAFAEVEPTEEMQDATEKAFGRSLENRDMGVDDLIRCAKTYIRAASDARIDDRAA